jgi:hypothetical protein
MDSRDLDELRAKLHQLQNDLASIQVWARVLDTAPVCDACRKSQGEAFEALRRVIANATEHGAGTATVLKHSP